MVGLTASFMIGSVDKNLEKSRKDIEIAFQGNIMTPTATEDFVRRVSTGSREEIEVNYAADVTSDMIEKVKADLIDGKIIKTVEQCFPRDFVNFA